MPKHCRRENRIVIWVSGVVVICVWDTFDLLFVPCHSVHLSQMTSDSKGYRMKGIDYFLIWILVQRILGNVAMKFISLQGFCVKCANRSS